VDKGFRGTTIHQASKRKHGFTGSYSAVRRFIQGLAEANPQVTTVLDFAPGEAAQVDFGKGPEITDVYTGEVFKTWFFVMTLVWSRHQYAELVRDQSVETWTGCVIGARLNILTGFRPRSSSTTPSVPLQKPTTTTRWYNAPTQKVPKAMVS